MTKATIRTRRGINATTVGREKAVARFETKPGTGSGAGYERWRSFEYRPHTPGDAKEDVYLYHHRLLAILLYPGDMPIDAVLADIGEKVVHHTPPSDLLGPDDPEHGIKWLNLPAYLEVHERGTHSAGHGGQSSFDPERIAAAARAARDRDQDPDADPTGVRGGPDRREACDGCGDLVDPALLARSDAFEGRRCLECVTEIRTNESNSHERTTPETENYL